MELGSRAARRGIGRRMKLPLSAEIQGCESDPFGGCVTDGVQLAVNQPGKDSSMGQPAASSASAVRFALFKLSLRSGELYRGDLRDRLQEQPFKALRTRPEAPGPPVTRCTSCGRDSTLILAEPFCGQEVSAEFWRSSSRVVQPRGDGLPKA